MSRRASRRFGELLSHHEADPDLLKSIIPGLPRRLLRQAFAVTAGSHTQAIAPELNRQAEQHLRGSRARVSVPAPAIHVPKRTREKKLAEFLNRFVEMPVSCGFSPIDQPGTMLRSKDSMKAGGSYSFWIDIGGLGPPLPSEPLRLTVALFSFPGEIGIDPGDDCRTIDARQGGRLSFPVRAPDQAGPARLRCSVYLGSLLIQSRVVQHQVATNLPSPRFPEIDYVIRHEVEPEQLRQPAKPCLSLLLNDNGNGSHSLRLLGSDGSEEFKSEATFTDGLVRGALDRAREALHLVSWGSPAPWNGKLLYRYENPLPRDLEVADLAWLAYHGSNLYQAIAGNLAEGDWESRKKLASLMRTPIEVEIALKQSPTLLLPAALLYDHPIDLPVEPDYHEYSICEAFSAALTSEAPLEDCVCFHGGCPVRERGERKPALEICPSGFWGFRHELGFPVSTGRHQAPSTIPREHLAMAVGVSTDPDLKLLKAHEDALRKLLPAGEYLHCDSRDGVFETLRSHPVQIAYFYGHCGTTRGFPYIQVGPLGDGILPAQVTMQLHWEKPRPLVFINGCHTTGLTPEQTFNFVSAFVRDAAAAGVIGTDITVFEPLARDFAEMFLRRFLSGTPAGAAVRGARLELLHKGNPLGLVYTPFVLGRLSLS